jgi:post-segregation antitoxin (ccd killing protein)
MTGLKRASTGDARSAALEERLINWKERGWLAENEAAIAYYNDRIDREGVFSNGTRRF